MNKKVPIPKFFPGEKVYAYLQDGMQLVNIETLSIRMDKKESVIYYYLKESYGHSYQENQLFATHRVATKHIEENKAQLQLALK